MALQIAKQKNSHTIGETLIKPCALSMVKLILGETSAQKIQQVSLSNDTIKRRISQMSANVKHQVINEIKASPMFSLQLDESTDVASCSQLLVFVRYVHTEDVKEEFLYCKVLDSTTTAQDVMDSISTFFETEGLQWEKLCGVCTDGAPAMLGAKSGFQTKVKLKSPQVRGVHCMIHRYALACKTLPLLKGRAEFCDKNSQLYQEECCHLSSVQTVMQRNERRPRDSFVLYSSTLAF